MYLKHLQAEESHKRSTFTKAEKRKLFFTSGNRGLLLGPSGAGKSSTARSLAWNLQYITEPDDRTVIADVLHWEPEECKNTTFTFLDLGGQASYRHSAHFFYINARNNINIFCHDITSEDYEETFYWIKSGITKAPLSEVIFVLTKIDLIKDEEEKQQKIDQFKKRLQDFLDKEIRQVTKAVSKMKKTQKKPARRERLKSIEQTYRTVKNKLVTKIFQVSCERKYESTFEALKNHLLSIAGKPENRVELAEEECELYLKIGTLGVKLPKEETESTSSEDEEQSKKARMHASDSAKNQAQRTNFPTLEEVTALFKDILCSKGLPTHNITQKTQATLATLHDKGLITYYSGDPYLENIVFNDIKRLIKLLETVFHHNVGEFLKFDVLDPEIAVDLFDNKGRFQSQLDNLKDTGVMSTKILEALLQHSKCDINATAVIRLLKKLEVGFPYTPDGSTEEHVFIPFFVEKKAQKEDVDKIKDKHLLHNGPKALILHGIMRDEASLTFLHILVLKIYHRIHNIMPLYKSIQRWKNCFFAELVEDNNNIKLMFLLNENNEVEFYIQSEIETLENHSFLWHWLKIASDENEHLTENWCPGLISDFELQCTNCTINNDGDPCKSISLDDILKDKSSSDTIICRNSTEKIPRGTMLPLSKDEARAKVQLKSLQQYLQSKISKSQEHEVRSLSIPLQETTPPEQPLESRPHAYGGARPKQPQGGHTTSGLENSSLGVIKIDIKQQIDSQASIKELVANEDVYFVHRRIRGRAVIINIQKFNDGDERHGSQYDATNLENLFRKLHFDTAVYNNLKFEEIKERVRMESQGQTVDQDAFVLCALSHGGRDEQGQEYIIGSDRKKVYIKSDLCDPFEGHKCRALVGKPKIFIIQACRGALETTGVLEPDVLAKAHQRVGVHEKSDVLIAQSTTSDYISWRDTTLGSVFIRKLVEVFAAQAHKDHIVDMLTEVRRNMPETQLSEDTMRLKKKFYFFPGYI